MIKNKLIKIFFLIVIIISSNKVVFNNAINRDLIEIEFHQTWKKLSFMDINDEDLSSIISSLNKCIELINIGGDENFKNADNILKEINAKIIVLENYEKQVKINQYIFSGIILTILIITSMLIWLYGSKIYWTFWFNIRKKWRVSFD